MTEFDRRDFVKLLTGLAVLGAFSKPDDAKAGGGGGAGSSVFILLVAATVIAHLYLIVLVLVFTANVRSARLVRDTSSSNRPSAPQRMRNAKKIGTVKLQGDALVANLNRNSAASLAKKRSVKISIPLPGKGQTIELSAQKQNKKTSEKIRAVTKSGGKTVGSVRQDKYGLLLDIRSIKLG